MLSRRNVRIKVMQVLYATSKNTPGNKTQAIRFYEKLIANSFALYLYNLVVLERVASYARQDKISKNKKLRPSEADLAFSSDLADNKLVRSLFENVKLASLSRKNGFSTKIDPDTVRKLYIAFGEEEAYKDFLKIANTTDQDFTNLLLELYKFLYKNEIFTDMVEDHFSLWEEDKSLIVGALKKTIKALPGDEDFLDAYFPDDETIKEFGESMLLKTLDADAELLAIIEPNLKNWDADRVATLDMVLIKMALVEFLHFKTIPTKVTINEIVELAKKYSTDKSKDFVNGILDRLQKDLAEKGLIDKKGRGLVDS